MKIKIKDNGVVVSRQTHEFRVKNESHLLYRLKIELGLEGYDFIKKLMWKDGHMVADTQHYLRARNKKDTRGTRGIFCIYDNDYSIRNSAEEFNKGNEVGFRIERN